MEKMNEIIKVVVAILPFMGLTMLSSALGTLKHILISKGQKKASYVTIFLDAIIFSTILKTISGGDGVLFGMSYATGKLLGAIIANKFEEFLALGILEVSISLNHFDKMVPIADNLRDLGYTVETYSVFGYGGKPRYKIDIVISRKELPILKEILKEYGYEDPTMTIKSVSKVVGKITVNSAK